MGYGGYGMMGGYYLFSFFLFFLLLALIWLVVSKALLNTRKFKMMKDGGFYGGKHIEIIKKHKHHDCDCDCHKEEKHGKRRKTKE